MARSDSALVQSDTFLCLFVCFPIKCCVNDKYRKEIKCEYPKHIDGNAKTVALTGPGFIF